MCKEWFSVLLFSCSLAACGEPFVATVGVIKGLAPHDAGGTEIDLDGDAPQSDERDAEAKPAEAGPGLDGGPHEDCVNLIDQSTPAGKAADDPDREVRARSLEEAVCPLVDGNDKPQSSLFDRVDGELMLEAGETYSLRWPPQAVFAKMRLFGGASQCSVEPIYSEAPAMFSPWLAAPNCRSFTSKSNASFVRLTNEFSNFSLIPYLTFQLCRAPCP
jgi:hypothetical protein